MLTLRPAVPDEFPQLAEMRWQFRTGHDAAHPKFDPSETARAEFTAACLHSLNESQTEERWTFRVAVEDGTIVSNACIDCIPRMSRLGRPRGQGIGAQLVHVPVVTPWAIPTRACKTRMGCKSRCSKPPAANKR